MRVLIWFRNDLRVSDNEMLYRAEQEGAEVIPFYCFDSIYDVDLSIGLPKTGRFRRRFLAEALMELRAKLTGLGAGLIFRSGDTASEIRRILESSPVDEIWFSASATSEEVAIEQSVEKIGVRMRRFSVENLLQEFDLPFAINDIPWLFTEFRKQVEKDLQIRSVWPAPWRLRVVNGLIKGEIRLENDLTELPASVAHDFNYAGGESQAWRRLQTYIWSQDRLKEYKETRNGMLGADYSSRFSLALAHGCLSPVQIYHQVKEYEQKRVANQSTYWLIFELLWRDFFRHTARAEGGLFFHVHKNQEFPWTDDHEAWRMGQTGADLVDACMNELRTTGFLGNRGRQIVASYLVNDLKAHWYPGAQYFESVLIDYDVTSNYGNWTYIAGVGHDPRKDRYFNLEKQAERYDPDGRYRAYWLDSKNTGG